MAIAVDIDRQGYHPDVPVFTPREVTFNDQWMLLRHKGRAVKAIVSEEGRQLLESNPNIIPKILKEKRPWMGRWLTSQIGTGGLSGYVTKENAGSFWRPYWLAVKHLYPLEEVWPERGYISGFDHMKIFRDLEQEGVDCIKPLLATHNKFISVWDFRTPAPTRDKWDSNKPKETFDAELFILGIDLIAKKLRGSGRWDSHWVVDDKAHGYFKSGINPVTGRVTFIAMDPVYHNPRLPENR